MAGESAREAARRQRDKAERLRRSAELWERGADGEEATARALQLLPAEEWRVLHDVRWPGRRFANVDHVAVGPGGVFVIDSKNWSGDITVDADVLRQNRRQRETAVAGAADAALAVAEMASPLLPVHVHAVLCFVRDEPLSGWARDVMVCSTSNVVDLLTTRPRVLGPEHVRRTSSDLERALVRSGRAGVAGPPSVGRSSSRPAFASRAQSRPAAARPPTRRSHRRAGTSGLRGFVASAALLALAVVAGPRLLAAAGEEVGRRMVDEVSDIRPTKPSSPPPEERRGQHQGSTGQPSAD